MAVLKKTKRSGGLQGLVQRSLQARVKTTRPALPGMGGGRGPVRPVPPGIAHPSRPKPYNTQLGGGGNGPPPRAFLGGRPGKATGTYNQTHEHGQRIAGPKPVGPHYLRKKKK